MEHTTPQEGTLHMCCHAGTFRAFAAFLVAWALLIVGCNQTASTEDHASQGSTTDAGASEAVPAESEPPETVEMPEAFEVKQATAESRVGPPVESPQEPLEAEPGDARLQRPRKLSAAMAPLPLDDVDAADLTMPKVNLTEHHAAMCRVGVGQMFPDLQLPDTTGEQQSLSQLMGDKLTLVVFWNGMEPTALEELGDLARYHQPRFGASGLAIVAINTGDDAQLAGELARQAGAGYAILSDADGAAFDQVATEKIPRTYLLDPSGTILWFDLEYSPTTLRDMVQAIRYTLARE